MAATTMDRALPGRKGLKADAVGFVNGVVLGIASTAPAYSLAATLAGVVAQIVGEVRDPFDKSAPQIQRLPDGSALVDGLLQIEEINDHFGLQLKDEHYDTIAGFVLGRLDRLAQVGDTVEAEGVRYLLRKNEAEAARELDEAVAFAEASPWEPAEDLLRDVRAVPESGGAR